MSFPKLSSMFPNSCRKALNHSTYVSFQLEKDLLAIQFFLKGLLKIPFLFFFPPFLPPPARRQNHLRGCAPMVPCHLLQLSLADEDPWSRAVPLLSLTHLPPACCLFPPFPCTRPNP